MNAIDDGRAEPADRAAPHEGRRYGARAREGARKATRNACRSSRASSSAIRRGGCGRPSPCARFRSDRASSASSRCTRRHPESGSRAVGARAPREALLPARSEGQGRPDEGNQAPTGRQARSHLVSSGVAKLGRDAAPWPSPARRTIENALGRLGLRCTSLAWTRSAGAAWPARSSPAPSCSIRRGTSPAFADSKLVPRAGRERLYDTITRRAWPGRSPPSSRLRSIASTSISASLPPCSRP